MGKRLFMAMVVIILVMGALFMYRLHAVTNGRHGSGNVYDQAGATHLSLMAQLGQRVFYDRRLSASGRESCSGCHSPAHHYGPPGDGPVQLAGPTMKLPGIRAVPSLEYGYRAPPFSIGPENEEIEHINLVKQARSAKDRNHVNKVAGRSGVSAAAMVPRGGLFWDGRASSLQSQAEGPLYSPFEMAAPSRQWVARKLRTAAYAHYFVALFGKRILNDDKALVAKAMFAVGRYEWEDPAFHPYNSKYDYYLNGLAKLTPAETRGLRIFEDKNKGNCAACHLDRVTPSGKPPMLTDYEFESLAVPRNTAIPANRNPDFHDLGLCGPIRRDLRTQTQYCGLFKTPSLRNVATRKVFFHNGVYHNLHQVLNFYAKRETDPADVYPRNAQGRVMKYNDLPQQYWANVDHFDAPFNRHPGEPPAMTRQEMNDVIAFLKTLTDGYRPGNPYHRHRAALP